MKKTPYLLRMRSDFFKNSKNLSEGISRTEIKF